MLQTVVAGSGAIQNIVWIPDVGVAVCSNRSKVSILPITRVKKKSEITFFIFFFSLDFEFASTSGRAGRELLQRVHDVKPRSGHVSHGSEETGCDWTERGALYESLPGETSCHAAGAVRLREGRGRALQTKSCFFVSLLMRTPHTDLKHIRV